MMADTPVPLPTRHVITAAVHVSHLVDTRPATQAVLDASYANYPTGGVFGVPDLRAGQQLLTFVGYVNQDADGYTSTESLVNLRTLDMDDAAEVLIRQYLQVANPSWLRIATGVLADGSDEANLAGGYIPQDAAASLTSVLPDADQREAMLMALGRRYDAEANAKIGRQGEEHVVAELRHELVNLGYPDLADNVSHVALVSDQLGYDITAPRIDGTKRRVEVKTTGRAVSSDVTFYVSRNEYETARQPGWYLVVCRLSADTTVTTVGWCTGGAVRAKCPVDLDPRGRWQQAEITLPAAQLSAGLPPAV